MGKGFEWGDFGGLTAGIKRAKAAKDEGVKRGLLLGARLVLDTSNRMVPHESGDLERDGGTSIDGSTAAIAYGRSASTKDYAVVQHEDMSLHHDSGRSAKYLENALNSTRDQVAQIIAQQIGTDLK